MPKLDNQVTVRMLLEDTLALLETHGHDDGMRWPGRVPLTLVGAMKVALDHSPRTPAWLLPRRSQVLIDCALSHLKGQFLLVLPGLPGITVSFPYWLKVATTHNVTNLITMTLDGDV